MTEERGQVDGDMVVSVPFTLWGSVGGSVTVVKGGKFYHRGTIVGDLRVESGGRVHIFGNVVGNLIVNSRAKVIHEGLVGGDAINDGGRLYVEAAGKVEGKLKTRAGETTNKGDARE